MTDALVKAERRNEAAAFLGLYPRSTRDVSNPTSKANNLFPISQTPGSISGEAAASVM